MNPHDLCRVEFADPSDHAHRKTHTNLGWCLEYAVSEIRENREDKKPPHTQRRTLFAFHGFARPLEDLLALSQSWPLSGTIISVHLPHHGQSRPIDPSLADDAPLDPATLNLLLVEIAQKEGASAPQYDLIGYSIGGRIGLALFSDSPAMWKRITLLAPDGLKKSPFYQLTVHTSLGRVLWFAIDRHAAVVLRWSDRLLKWRIISPHLHGFCSFHLSHHAMRMMVWKGWRAHRLCWPKHGEIMRALEDWSGQMDLAFGAHDRIIPATNSERLQQLTNQNDKVRFHVVPSGHGMLKPEIVQKLIHRIFPT